MSHADGGADDGGSGPPVRAGDRLMQAAPLIRSNRGTHLALTILAVALSVGAYVLVTLGTTGRTPADVGAFVSVIGVAYLIGHLLVVRAAPGADPALFPTAAVLAGTGKVLIVVFLASYLSGKKELLAVATRRIGPLRLPEPRYLGPLLLAWLVSLAVLFMEKDLGSSLLFFGGFVIMLWTATARGSYLVLGLMLFAIGAVIGYLAFAHVQDRVIIWLHALEPNYVHAKGYQLAQGEFAMATGGIAGTGL